MQNKESQSGPTYTPPGAVLNVEETLTNLNPGTRADLHCSSANTVTVSTVDPFQSKSGPG
jgi:hypothetical protein